MAETTINQGSDQNNDGAGAEGSAGGSGVQSLKDNVVKLANDAGDKAKGFADEGKARAGDALDDLARMLHDAAASVDAKVGEQYGQYARSAADAVGNFSQSFQAKSIDDLIGEARDFAKKSPAVAIGTAAAIGFVIARLVKAGLDAPKPVAQPDAKSA